MYKELYIENFRLFQNQRIIIGKYLTVLSGRNSTGKSTILGMIANSGELKKKDGVTYSSKAFRAEFSELFKGSKRFDVTGPNRFKITLCDENGNETDYRSFRTAWQTKDGFRTGKQDAAISKQSIGDSIKQGKMYQGKRFRIIPFKKLDNGKKTEAKFNYPVLYLGLSRLFPIGESQDSSISTKAISFESEEHHEWFVEKYKSILSMQDNVETVTNYSIGESDKKSGIGINTNHYDYLTNSSGQDNLGQILLALLSFKKLKEKCKDSWQGGVLLIDEIDATLHPAAQCKLLKLLLQEARNDQIQIVVTTHSLSFLQEICKRTAHNNHDVTVNNTIELYYLTNANRKLEIKRNLSFSEIESDLMIISAVQNCNKIKLYTEDAEARWFLKHLISDYLVYINELDITIGCDQLINLYGADLQYFGNALIILDGDVSEKQLEKIPKVTRDNLGNILKLPGEKSPEEVVYDYLMSLGPEHDFWVSGAQIVGFTWDYFNEHGPYSGDYEQVKDREKCKKWFINHQQFFESTKLMDFWKIDNSQLVQDFRNDFLLAHDHIAKRTMVMTIKE